MKPQAVQKSKRPNPRLDLGERPRPHTASLEPSPFQNADPSLSAKGGTSVSAQTLTPCSRRGLVLRALGFLSVRLRGSEQQADSTPASATVANTIATLLEVECAAVLLFSKPSPQRIREFVFAQENETFSYPDVGAPRAQAPSGYVVDHNRVQLGNGPDTFERAKRGINTWKMFDIPWLALCWPDSPIEAGTTVAVLVSHLRFWSLNGCRIVYVMQERHATETYGFAYGTLRQHGEMGEERFTVEFNHTDQSVWYDIYAFSRPHLLPRLVYPFTRTLQKRFARDSLQAMLRAAS